MFAMPTHVRDAELAMLRMLMPRVQQRVRRLIRDIIVWQTMPLARLPNRIVTHAFVATVLPYSRFTACSFCYRRCCFDAFQLFCFFDG